MHIGHGAKIQHFFMYILYSIIPSIPIQIFIPFEKYRRFVNDDYGYFFSVLCYVLQCTRDEKKEQQDTRKPTYEDEKYWKINEWIQ